MTASEDRQIHRSIAQIFLVERKRRISLIGYALFFLLVFALSGFFQPVRAADGDLDLTFGSGGKVMTGITNNSDFGYSVAVQPDGKIIVVGQSGVDVFHSTLMRYNGDGSLDQTFGSGGIVFAPLDSNGDVLSSVVLQSDGKILAVGSLTGNNVVEFLLARFNTNGSLDQSFGSNGSVVTTFGDHIAGAGSVVLLPDGKIIVVGASGAGAYSELNDFAVARYNSNGSLDQSYGSGGMLKTHFDGEYNTGSTANSALLQSDGKLIVAGSYKNEGTPREFAVARYDTNGNLDPTFGNGGKTTTSLGAGDSLGFAARLQSDGKIVLAGYLNAGQRNHDFALVRYNPDGALDTSFGNGGKVTNDLFGTSDDIAYSLVIQPDGKLIVGGRTGQYPNFKFGLARYNTYGSLDQSFGSAGKVMTDFGGFSSQSYSSAIQSDGKIVIAGYAQGNSADIALARYRVTVPHTPQFDFDGDLKADISVFRQGTWYLNRSTAGLLGFQFGFNTDSIVPADYDGDGHSDLAVFRPSEGNWYWLNSGSNTYSIVHFGMDGDIPAPADYDGDGRADYAVFRSGVWYIQGSTAGLLITQFGLAADKIVPADYDGDGKTDVAVFRNGVWYINRSAQGLSILQFGIAGDKPVSADYDGDGKADIAVWRPENGVWYIIQSLTGTARIFAWGASGDIPTPGDYDGDGKTDPALYRGSGEWWIWRSQTNNYSVQLFGNSGDLPVPSVYIH
jgi:uncharacterized delta-60 repeat protein